MMMMRTGQSVRGGATFNPMKAAQWRMKPTPFEFLGV